MDPNNIIAARRSLGLEKPEFARLLGVSYGAVQAWEKGTYPIGRMGQERIHALLAHRREHGALPSAPLFSALLRKRRKRRLDQVDNASPYIGKLPGARPVGRPPKVVSNGMTPMRATFWGKDPGPGEKLLGQQVGDQYVITDSRGAVVLLFAK